jgi:hypothetical protein
VPSPASCQSLLSHLFRGKRFSPPRKKERKKEKKKKRKKLVTLFLFDLVLREV